MFRIGIGHDTHRLEHGRKLVLGGVLVESEAGAVGHSDADALCHAVTDAVLGALALGDIGAHFPDTDERWRGADSLHLLARVIEMAESRGWRVVNLDSTVMIERPRLRPYVEQMRERLSEVLKVEIDCVSVKAKTGERVDAVGEGRAVTAQAIALIERRGDESRA